MKLFLDSALLTEIREAVSWSIVNGITTNPSLIKKAVLAKSEEGGEDLDMESYIKQILALAGRMNPVSLEVAGLTVDEMVDQGMALYEKFDPVASNVVIKIPVCTIDTRGEGNPFDGISAIRQLADEKIPVNATLVFTPEQALLAAKAGADYVSPFAGRIDDRIRKSLGVEFAKTDYFPADGVLSPDEEGGWATECGLYSGVDLVAKTVEIFRNYDIECQVIAASVRNTTQIREFALVGSDIATVPFPVLRDMVGHEGTREGIDAFTADLVDEYTGLLQDIQPRDRG